MKLPIFKIIFLLIGFISLTSSTVPASRTPKIKKTTKSKLTKKDKHIYRLKVKADKQKKIKRQKNIKAIKTWSWLSLLLGLLSATAMLFAIVAAFTISAGLSSFLVILAISLGIGGLVTAILNFTLEKDLNAGDWIMSIVGIIVSLSVLLFFVGIFFF